MRGPPPTHLIASSPDKEKFHLGPLIPNSTRVNCNTGDTWAYLCRPPPPCHNSSLHTVEYAATPFFNIHWRLFCFARLIISPSLPSFTSFIYLSPTTLFKFCATLSTWLLVKPNITSISKKIQNKIFIFFNKIFVFER